MKKILITGFNKNQCTRKFYLNQQLKVIPSHYSLFNCLVDMGYEVEQRVVELGEDISHYDEVIIFLAGPRQLVTTVLFNGLWALSQRPDAILAFDDWQIQGILDGISKCMSQSNLFCDFILNVNKKTKEELEPFASAFMQAIKIILLKENRILISAFDTSHVENRGLKLLFENYHSTNKFFAYNPNPYHRNRTLSDFSHEGVEDPTFKKEKSLFSNGQSVKIQKERRFNFASLVQSSTKKWLKNQGINIKNIDSEQLLLGDWPIDLYGSKASSQKRLTEDQMCLTFAKDWACLMPGYTHAGSGWWRARPLQVADAGSILIGEKKELEVYYGKDFEYIDLRAIDLLDMSDEELSNIAAKQKEALYKNHPLDKEVQKKELNRILEAK